MFDTCPLNKEVCLYADSSMRFSFYHIFCNMMNTYFLHSVFYLYEGIL